MLAQGLGHGESDLNCGILGLNGLGLFVDAEGKQVFEGSGGVQAPGVVGAELRPLLFQPAFGFEVLAKGLGEAVVLLELLGGETTV